MPTSPMTAFAMPALAGRAPESHRLLRAFRVAALASGQSDDPQPRLIELLGSPHAASCFRLLLAGMAHVWPDPLISFRPCCPRLTPDEAALLAMVTHAAHYDRRAFDDAIAEMIAEDARDWLFITAARLADAMRG
jgi:hypothetical protein